jgi:hypothetical protein
MQLATDIMVFLPYTPRADSDARGYDQWLREVDAPFFNSVPGILHYSNWKVTNPAPGAFTHFDFMYLDPALADAVWTNQAVIEFAGGWTEKWGIDPQAADLSVNYNSYRLKRLSGQSLFEPGAVRIAEAVSATPRFGGAVWEVEQPMVGTSPTPFYEFAFGAAAAAASGPADSMTGTIIAAPGL